MATGSLRLTGENGDLFLYFGRLVLSVINVLATTQIICEYYSNMKMETKKKSMRYRLFHTL